MLFFHKFLRLCQFVSGSPLALWSVGRTTWVGQLALSLASSFDHSSNQHNCFPVSDETFAGYRRDFVLVHQIELKIRSCSYHCFCSPFRRTKCCGCSRISLELTYHSLVLKFYDGLARHRNRLTINLVETISRLDVFKDCNFNFTDWS